MLAPVRCNSARFLVSAVCISLCACLLLAPPARQSAAATKVERQSAAKQNVQEALHREIYGQGDERAELLARAAADMPNYAPAMWHRGYVRWQKKWIKAEDLPGLIEKNPRVLQYRRTRGDYPLTVEGQLQLANWCAEKDLPDRERAHLLSVLQIDQNHVEAHRRLGDRRINGEWVSPDELEAAARQLAAANESLEKWEDRFATLIKLLEAPSERKRSAAREQILAISEIDAIPALEYQLAAANEAAAKLAVEALGKYRANEAAAALARVAVFSSWEEVRRAAADHLRPHATDSYVPLLLANMYTPYTSRRVLRGMGDSLLYRHVFMREGQDEQESLVLDTSYRRIARIGGDGDETLARMLASASATAGNRERTLEQMNRRTEVLNERVAAVLNVATQQNLPAHPQTWWDWWNKQNELLLLGQKPQQVERRGRQVDVVDYVPQPVGGGRGGQGGGVAPWMAAIQALGVSAPCECLAPGTLVWTAAGSLPIEEVQVGDMVLSQDPDSGELAYKPVVRTTLRPKERLVKIEAGNSVIQASNGHPFWVSGEGWVLARDLASGMELHCATGSQRITAISAGDEIETHNLIVDGFCTYFVGPHRVLSHDNSDRRPTNAVVPGLKVE